MGYYALKGIIVIAQAQRILSAPRLGYVRRFALPPVFIPRSLSFPAKFLQPKKARERKSSKKDRDRQFEKLSFINPEELKMAKRSWIEEEEQIDLESCCSDSGNVAEGPVSEKFDEVSSNGMLNLGEEGEEYIMLKHRFYLSIGALSQSCTVVDAYRNLHSSPMERARLEAFRMFMEAMAAKRDGNPNVVHAWYGATKAEVHQIMKEGFRVCGMPRGSVHYGFGLHLYPERSACDSLLSAPVDADGLRHLVVCRVILGSTEEILPGSMQSGSSSENFDSGVDNLQSPSKYIVWYPDVKRNILPLYAVSVKFDIQSRGLQREPAKQPSSPWMPFTSLVHVLSGILPRSSLSMIRRLHTDFLERKTSRQQFIFRVRQLTGDKILVSAIRDFQDKRTKGILKTTGNK